MEELEALHVTIEQRSIALEKERKIRILKTVRNIERKERMICGRRNRWSSFLLPFLRRYNKQVDTNSFGKVKNLTQNKSDRSIYLTSKIIAFIVPVARQAGGCHQYPTPLIRFTLHCINLYLGILKGVVQSHRNYMQLGRRAPSMS